MIVLFELNSSAELRKPNLRETMPNITSGEKLFNWISKKYESKNQYISWVDKISADFSMRELEDILFQSTVLMLTRRFISNAAWYVKRYPGDPIAVIEIFDRDYLQGSLGFAKDERRVVRLLIFDSLKASESEILNRTSNTIFARAKNTNQRCKLCGKAIDFTLKSTDPQAFSLDHIWPKSLGGESEEWNLQVTHKSCNTQRLNIANESDTHYEHFNVKSIWTDNSQDSFWKEFNWQFRFAALMKAKFRCEVCKESESESIDNMDMDYHYSLKNREENYNLFNIQVTCDKHKKIIGT